MREIAAAILAVVLIALPVTTIAQPDSGVDGGAVTALAAPVELTDVKDAAGAVEQAIAAARGGSWWLFAAIIVSLIMFGLKRFALLAKLGRWKYVVAPVLSLAAALLAAFQADLSFTSALGVFTASWATSAIQQAWKRGIMGETSAAPAKMI